MERETHGRRWHKKSKEPPAVLCLSLRFSHPGPLHSSSFGYFFNWSQGTGILLVTQEEGLEVGPSCPLQLPKDSFLGTLQEYPIKEEKEVERSDGKRRCKKTRPGAAERRIKSSFLAVFLHLFLLPSFWLSPSPSFICVFYINHRLVSFSISG